MAGPNTKPKLVGRSTHDKPQDLRRPDGQKTRSCHGTRNGAPPRRAKQVKAVNRPQGERTTTHPALPAQSTDDTDETLEPAVPQPRKKKKPSSLNVLFRVPFLWGTPLIQFFRNRNSLLDLLAVPQPIRPSSKFAPVLVRYLEMQKAVKAVECANAVAQSLAPLPSEGSSKKDVTAAHIDSSFSAMRQSAFEQLLSEAFRVR